MDKLKEIENVERAEQRLMFYWTLPILTVGFTSIFAPLLLSFDLFWLTPLLAIPVVTVAVLLIRRSFKNTKRFTQLRREWLEEMGLPKEADFTYPLYAIAEGESRTFTHQTGDEVIVYRLAKRNGEFVVSTGVAELTEVKAKETERPFVEETENDELWKLIDSNSSTED